MGGVVVREAVGGGEGRGAADEAAPGAPEVAAPGKTGRVRGDIGRRMTSYPPGDERDFRRRTVNNAGGTPSDTRLGRRLNRRVLIPYGERSVRRTGHSF